MKKEIRTVNNREAIILKIENNIPTIYIPEEMIDGEVFPNRKSAKEYIEHELIMGTLKVDDVFVIALLDELIQFKTQATVMTVNDNPINNKNNN